MQSQTSAPLDTPASGVVPLEVTVVACTDIGRNRQNNEDNYLVFDLRRRKAEPAGRELVTPVVYPGLLLAVADGMGGHQAGQVASQMCVEHLSAELLKLLPEKPEGVPDSSSALTRAVETTSNSIYSLAKQNPDYGGMGTTLTTMLLGGTQALIGQVGDSRTYLFRHGRLTQLTQDQTIANSLRRNVPGAQVESRFEGILVQAVGAVPSVDVEVTATELEPGDLLLMCTDGLYRVVTPAEMKEILARSGSVSAKGQVLIARANEGGGPDNITLILCEVRKSGGEQ